MSVGNSIRDPRPQCPCCGGTGVQTRTDGIKIRCPACTGQRLPYPYPDYVPTPNQTPDVPWYPPGFPYPLYSGPIWQIDLETATFICVG